MRLNRNNVQPISTSLSRFSSSVRERLGSCAGQEVSDCLPLNTALCGQRGQQRSGTSRVLLLACLLLVLLPSAALASHFRYAHLSWRGRPDIGPTAVDLTLTLALRRCGYRGNGSDGCPVIGDIVSESIGGTTLNFGDGTSAPASGPLQLRVTAYDVSADWIIAVALDPSTSASPIRHSYPTATNSGQPWLAAITSCCRLSSIQNAPDGSYRVETSIDLATTIGSPISNLPPVVACQQNTSCTFAIPASAPGAPVNWRLALPSEDGGIAHPPDLSVNSATGVVNWSTVGIQTQSLWATQVVIEAREISTGRLLSKSAVDFLIIVIASGDPPIIVPPPNSAPICNTTLPAVVNTVLSFVVSASDPNASDSVTLNTAGLPTGASMTPALPLTGNPVSSTFSWTPTVADVGTTIVTFTGTDQLGLQTLCPVTIQVVQTPAGITVGGATVGTLAPGQTGFHPTPGTRRAGVLLTVDTTTDFRVLLPGPIIERSASGDQGTFDLTVQNNWKAWYYVTTLPVGLVGQTSPGAFLLPPGESRSFRVTFQRGDTLTLFADAGFRTPPQDRQDRLLLSVFALDLLWRLAQGSSPPYTLVAGIEASIDITVGLFNPLIGLGYHIATLDILSLPGDIHDILKDTALTQKLVGLGFSKAALDKLSGFTGFLNWGIRLRFVTEYLINELIAATTRPFGDLTFRAR